jgi:hypothetical protein
MTTIDSPNQRATDVKQRSPFENSSNIRARRAYKRRPLCADFVVEVAEVGGSGSRLCHAEIPSAGFPLWVKLSRSRRFVMSPVYPDSRSLKKHVRQIMPAAIVHISLP